MGRDIYQCDELHLSIALPVSVFRLVCRIGIDPG